MQIAYVVQHVHIIEEDDEDVKMIGVYSTEILAQEAIERLRLLPGFCDAPDGFTIDHYDLDADNWTSGFVTLPGIY
ncbi:MAG TPA: hypothetical protein VGB45_11215 [Abditibacterium sp.]|jgi:hypothetical protein